MTKRKRLAELNGKQASMGDFGAEGGDQLIYPTAFNKNALTKTVYNGLTNLIDLEPWQLELIDPTSLRRFEQPASQFDQRPPNSGNSAFSTSRLDGAPGTQKQANSSDVFIDRLNSPSTAARIEESVKLAEPHKTPYWYLHAYLPDAWFASLDRSVWTVTAFGGGRKALKAQAYFTEDNTSIEVMRNMMVVWPKKPKGRTLDEQYGELEARADAVAHRVAAKNRMGQIRPERKPAQPHLIITDKSLARALKPHVKAGEIPGASINQRSHPGAVEITENAIEAGDAFTMLFNNRQGMAWLLQNAPALLQSQESRIQQQEFASENISKLVMRSIELNERASAVNAKVSEQLELITTGLRKKGIL